MAERTVGLMMMRALLVLHFLSDRSCARSISILGFPGELFFGSAAAQLIRHFQVLSRGKNYAIDPNSLKAAEMSGQDRAAVGHSSARCPPSQARLYFRYENGSLHSR